MAYVDRKTGGIIAETSIKYNNKEMKKIKQISRLLHNKGKVKEIPNKKYMALAQLVLTEAEKLD